jgi:UDP-N-acetylmuramoylalanine--D-glutamate ligase
MRDWKNTNVIIIGAARQGLALAHYLLSQGARVTISDLRSAEQLERAVASLHDLPVDWQLGSNDVSLIDGKDVLCVSGGVPLDLPIVQAAYSRNLPVLNDSQIFMENVPCKTIGITGSAGKTTTTTLVGRMAEKAARFSHKAWVGGNIGRPLIDVVNQIKPQDVVVLEFSSFQLEIMDKSPNVAVILNITPNHLDRHGTMEAYTRIKSRIFRYQRADDWTILGSDDPRAWGLRSEAPGRLAAFGFAPVEHVPGAYIHDNQITLFDGVREKEILPVSEVELRGQHNLLNVLAACAAAQAAGFPHDAIRAGIRGFGGVPHRLEFVRQYKGAAWYNDSKATTPEGAAAATRSFTEPLIVLLGGRDKHLPWDNLAKQVRASVDHVIAFGEAAPLVLQAIGPLQAGGRPQTIDHCETLAQAVERAAQLAEPGDVVLLAPGGTSYDEFNNFEERGDRYKEWVNKLQP